jgi:hypothetical protein
VKYLRNIAPALIAAGLLMASTCAAMAQTETTTVRTTTVTTDPFVLPVGVTYAVVDPLTGVSKGVYDPITKRMDFAVSPGLVIVDNTSNKVVATFDASGNVIALTSAPVYDPLFVSIESRRADFDRIIREIKLGGYDTATIAGLRSDLDRINAMEVAYTSDGTRLTYAEELALAVQLNDSAIASCPSHAQPRLHH